MVIKNAYLSFRAIEIPVNEVEKIKAILNVVNQPKGIIIFAHGSGSGRLSPRNQYVANILSQNGFDTLLFDLLTDREEIIDNQTRRLRFDIPLLTSRLLLATDWSLKNKETQELPIGYFGASTGAAAALCAAAGLGSAIKAVVSRGGRPDLAMEKLPDVTAPTLFIVGGDDLSILELNEQAAEQLTGSKEISIIPGASHLFEEPGALEEVARVSAKWFNDFMK